MAAFIQKLFKSRKTPEAAPKHRKADQPEPVEQEDTRASQREEQLGTLEGSPSQSDLAKLAIEGVTSDIRQTAAGRLTDEASLQEVQKQAKGRDKGFIRRSSRHFSTAVKNRRDCTASARPLPP